MAAPNQGQAQRALLTINEVIRVTGFKHHEIMEGCRERTFPLPVKYGGRIMWWANELPRKGKPLAKPMV